MTTAPPPATTETARPAYWHCPACGTRVWITAEWVGSSNRAWGHVTRIFTPAERNESDREREERAEWLVEIHETHHGIGAA